MPDEIKGNPSELTETQQVVLANPFASESWSETPVKPEEQPIVAEEKKEEPKKEEEEILDPKEWVKREFEIEDPDILKQQIKEYRELKQKPQVQEYKFENDESKKLADAISKGDRKKVIDILEKQDKIESFISAEVNDDNAEAILKLAMRLKHEELSAREIEYKFNKEFGLPKEPVKREDELDEDFEARKAEWAEKVNDIKMNRNIEAKLAKPELEKLKAKLVLPEIQQKESQQTVKEPTQEELEAFNKSKDSFLQSAEVSINNFNGFSVPVKDKDVDYTVSYAPSQDEKTFISGEIKRFAESGFDANALLAERWVNEDKTINVNQMVKDLSRIYGDDKVSQKLVNDAANKRLEIYLKEKKQINVNEQNQNGRFNPNGDDKSEMAKVQDFFWLQS